VTDEQPIPKQVLVVRTDLKMRKGKTVSQGAHASGKVFFDTIPREELERGWPEGFSRIKLTIEVDKSMFLWLAGIFTKVCCRVDSEEELLEIYERAKAAGLPCCLITDAGRTEFHGVPTNTAVSVGPAMPEEIDPITGNLKLL
jgi:peptidyl-tRNA hydrolase, PTH2 family